MPKHKTPNEAFIMSMGQKAGNLKGRTASAPKPHHSTAKAGDGGRKGHGKRPTQGAPMKAKMQSTTGTTYSGVGNAMAKGPYKDRHQSSGKVNSGWKVH